MPGGNRGLHRYQGPQQPGAYPWDWLVHGHGTASQRPAACPALLGYYWWSSDTSGGTLYQCQLASGVATWVQITPGITIAAGAITNAMLAGSIDLTSKVTGALPIANGGSAATTAYGALDAFTVQGADIASATTTDLSAATGESLTVTGTTTITGLGTAAAGVKRFVRFSGALTLTHNATSLILPGAASITTAAGDTAHLTSLGSGNWRCWSYFRAAARPVSGTNTGDQTVPTAASASDEETGTSTTVFTCPSTQHRHQSACKGWVVFDGVGDTTGASYNVTSITDNSVGNFSINWTTAFSSAQYGVTAVSDRNQTRTLPTTLPTATVYIVQTLNSSGSVSDPAWASVAAFGDQ